MLNQELLLWTFCVDRGFACEWLVGVVRPTEIFKKTHRKCNSCRWYYNGRPYYNASALMAFQSVSIGIKISSFLLESLLYYPSFHMTFCFAILLSLYIFRYLSYFVSFITGTAGTVLYWEEVYHQMACISCSQGSVSHIYMNIHGLCYI